MSDDTARTALEMLASQMKFNGFMLSPIENHQFKTYGRTKESVDKYLRVNGWQAFFATEQEGSSVIISFK